MPVSSVARILYWTSSGMIYFDLSLNMRPLRSDLSLPTSVWNQLQGSITLTSTVQWSVLGEHFLFWILSKSSQLRSSETVSGMAMFVIFNVYLERKSASVMMCDRYAFHRSVPVTPTVSWTDTPTLKLRQVYITRHSVFSFRQYRNTVSFGIEGNKILSVSW